MRENRRPSAGVRLPAFVSAPLRVSPWPFAYGGYSLVELMAAVAVFSVGMLGIVQGYHFGFDKIRTMREAAVATRAVQDQIERLRGMPFDALTPRENAGFVEPAPDLSSLVNAKPVLSIVPYTESALGLKEVRVSVRWSGDNGRTMERAATTLITDKDRPVRAKEASKS